MEAVSFAMSKKAQRYRGSSDFDELTPKQFIALLKMHQRNPSITYETCRGMYSNNHFPDWGFLPPDLRYFITGLDAPEAGCADSGAGEAGPSTSGAEDDVDIMVEDAFEMIEPVDPPGDVQLGSSSANFPISHSSVVEPSLPPAPPPVVPSSRDSIAPGPSILTPYIRAVDASLIDFAYSTFLPLPVVACSVPGVSLFCLPCGLTDSANLDFHRTRYVMVRKLRNGKFELSCDCVSDLSTSLKALMLIGDSSSAPYDALSPAITDLCQHSQALLHVCRFRVATEEDNSDTVEAWWKHPGHCDALMAYAAGAAGDDGGDFNWMESEESAVESPMCRRLPFRCGTKVFEVVVDREVLNRRQRTQASAHPGSIVTQSITNTISCTTHTRHGTCDCEKVVQKALGIEKLVQEIHTDVHVHANGKSLAIHGNSLTPIKPEPHPHVAAERMWDEEEDIEDDDWRAAEADRFRYAYPTPSPTATFISWCRSGVSAGLRVLGLLRFVGDFTHMVCQHV